MEAKEKAQELVNKFRPFAYMFGDCRQEENDNETKNSKQCALIVVDEMLKLNCLSAGWQEGTNLPLTNTMRPYWQEVKNEINNL